MQEFQELIENLFHDRELPTLDRFTSI
jgi:hypothetical protein